MYNDNRNLGTIIGTFVQLPILIILFFQGFLVTLCANGIFYLWSIKDQEPEVLHTLEFSKAEERYYGMGTYWYSGNMIPVLGSF